MHDIQMRSAFVATGCEHTSVPQLAVTVGAGVIGTQVYDVVTTKGSNYTRLAEIKRRYDPAGLFFVHNGVGSQEWSADGFTKV